MNFEDYLSENLNDPYLIPGTDVLRNKLEVIDPSELECSERLHTAGRLAELMIKPIKGNFDLKHLQRIHYAIFQDVYEWAGLLRNVGIGKNFTQFASAEYLESSASDIFDRLARENYLRGLSVRDFAKSAALYLSDVNALHPFRDGNGRAQREFFRDLALKAGYMLANGSFFMSYTRNRIRIFLLRFHCCPV
jgi:cell filamentation protein